MIKTMIPLLVCSFICSICYGRNGIDSALKPAVDTSKNHLTRQPLPPGNGSSESAPPKNTVDSTTPPRVEGITIFHSGSKDSTDSRNSGVDTGKVAYPGNIISFEISNPTLFLKTKPSDQARVVLYVDGLEMPGITSDWNSKVTSLQIQGGKERLPKLKEREIINIQLVRNLSSQSSWNFLYSNTESFTNNSFYVMHASVGWEHMSPLDKGEGDNSLIVAFYRDWEFWVWSLLYIVILAFFIYFASSTDVLKASNEGPYSLSNTQGLFWTFLVIGAFIYTLLLTDTSMSFNTSILGMLGISLGTTGVATAIDHNKINSNRAYTKRRQTFFKDLLTDGDSYSVQRLQTFAWNFILGLYFIFYTIKNKTMPEFSTAVLLLAGFSSTSYLSGKLSENTAASVAAQNAQAAVTAAAPQQPIQVPKP